MRKKVTWQSNAPWVATGYGTQTALFVPQLAKLGYDVAISAFYGLQGCRRQWAAPDGQEFTVYPGGQNVYANDVMGAHHSHWCGGEKGIFFILTDPWVLFSNLVQRLPAVAWVPIDHDPLIPETLRWFKDSHAIPVAMSRFGQRVLEAGGFEPLYVPHGYDPAVFHPKERVETRDAVQFPQDAFVISMVAANKGAPSRKGFCQALTAFKIFHEKHKDSKLYLHTQVKSPDGENLVDMAQALGIKPAIPHQYLFALGLPPEHVASIMTASDVLLNPAHGEGFGVPMIEAQACGTPVIGTNFSATPEVVGPAGWLIDGQQTWTNFGSWQVTPSVEAIVAALEEAYDEPEADRLARRELTAEHASQYAVERVADEHLRPAMREVEDRLDWKDTRGAMREA